MVLNYEEEFDNVHGTLPFKLATNHRRVRPCLKRVDIIFWYYWYLKPTVSATFTSCKDTLMVLLHVLQK